MITANFGFCPRLLSFSDRHFFLNLTLFWKTAFTQTFTFQSPPPENRNLIQKACSIVERRQSLHFLEITGCWLTMSVSPRMTSGHQRPSERFAAILCFLAKGLVKNAAACGCNLSIMDT